MSPVLVCPSCALAERGTHRIGAQRFVCPECSRWGANLTRLAARTMRAEHPAEWEKARLRAELELYPKVLARFRDEHPESRLVVHRAPTRWPDHG